DAPLRLGGRGDHLVERLHLVLLVAAVLRATGGAAAGAVRGRVVLGEDGGREEEGSRGDGGEGGDTHEELPGACGPIRTPRRHGVVAKRPMLAAPGLLRQGESDPRAVRTTVSRPRGRLRRPSDGPRARSRGPDRGTAARAR